MLIRVLSRTPGTALHRELADDDWTLDQHLLALAVDALRIGNWQRSKDGSKTSRRPKPVSPLAQDRQGETVGDAGEHSPEETKQLLEQYRTGVFEHGG